MAKLIDDVLASRRGMKGGRVQVPSASSTKKASLKTVIKGRYRTLASKGPNPALGRASGVMKNIDYMTTRPDYSHQRTSRDVITPDGRINVQNSSEQRKLLQDELTNAKEKYIYHIIMSAGEKNMSERDVEVWAKKVLQSQGIDKYYMVAHAGQNGHTSNPHAHVILRSDVRLGREDFFNMRRAGDSEMQLHKYLFRSLEEAWRDKFGGVSDTSGGGQRDIDGEQQGQSRRRDTDIHFE